MPDFVILAFVFAFGACVGSFLNVVVWRMPRGQSLVTPPSRCPKCEHKLAWYDNIPVFGWIFLGGKCRYCKAPVSPRYPIFEALTGAMFAAYYIAFFDLQLGPCRPTPRLLNIQQDWPIFALYLFMLSSLLAASLIDWELYIIPLEICWLMAAIGAIAHAIVDTPTLPGNLILPSAASAMSAGALIGWLISLALMKMKILRRSFPDGEPLLDVDREHVAAELEEARKRGETPPPLPPPYTRMQIVSEMRYEMMFMLPALLLAGIFGLLVMRVPAITTNWNSIAANSYVGGFLGAVLGAMVGGAVVWITRILGTLGFGRVAMGLGDVHLMFGVGAIIGAGAVTVAFFLAPFAGMVVALYMLATRKHREIPYGPYLSLGTAATLLFYCPISAWLKPGLNGLAITIQEILAR